MALAVTLISIPKRDIHLYNISPEYAQRSIPALTVTINCLALRRSAINLLPLNCNAAYNNFYRREILQSVEKLENINPSGSTNLSPGLAEVGCFQWIAGMSASMPFAAG